MVMVQTLIMLGMKAFEKVPSLVIRNFSFLFPHGVQVGCEKDGYLCPKPLLVSCTAFMLRVNMVSTSNEGVS